MLARLRGKRFRFVNDAANLQVEGNATSLGFCFTFPAVVNEAIRSHVKLAKPRAIQRPEKLKRSFLLLAFLLLHLKANEVLAKE